MNEKLKEALERCLRHLKMSHEGHYQNAIMKTEAQCLRDAANAIEAKDADIQFARDVLAVYRPGEKEDK